MICPNQGSAAGEQLKFREPWIFGRINLCTAAVHRLEPSQDCFIRMFVQTRPQCRVKATCRTDVVERPAPLKDRPKGVDASRQLIDRLRQGNYPGDLRKVSVGRASGEQAKPGRCGTRVRIPITDPGSFART